MIGKKIINYFKTIFQNFLQAEEQRINLCLPIAFALGIIFYFALPFEPSLWIFLCLFILSIIGFILLRQKSNLALLFLFTLFFFAGVCRIILQTNWVQSPFIHKRYSFVSVEGTVEKVELRQSGFRLTLTDLKLDKIPEQEKPIKIRVSLNGQKFIPAIGDIISLKATLSMRSNPHESSQVVQSGLILTPKGMPKSTTSHAPSIFHNMSFTGGTPRSRETPRLLTTVSS